MVVIERQRVDGPTWATFTAVMAGDGRTARGTLVNAGGNYGLMFMVRREFLSDFKHLLTEEGRQAEAARRWIGIEKLEVALDTESHGHGPNRVVESRQEQRRQIAVCGIPTSGLEASQSK